MRLPSILTAGLLTGLLAAAAAAGETVTITFSSTFLGLNCPQGSLDGADFTWSGTFDADAPPVASGPTWSEFEATSMTVTVSGSEGSDGVYTPSSLDVRESGGAFGPSLFSIEGLFPVGGVDLDLGAITMAPGFSNGVGSPGNTITPFDTWDMSHAHEVIYDGCAYIRNGLGAASGSFLPELEITYTGSLTAFAPFPDLALLDGGDFVWTGRFPIDSEPSATNGVDEDAFEGEILLTITGSAGADGVYTPVDNAISEYAAGSTQLRLSSTATFDINGTSVRVGGLIMADGFDNGALSPSNTLDPVRTADVDTFTSWLGEVPAPGSGLAIYELTDPQITAAVVHAPWYDECEALAGVDGEPQLVGVGSLVGGSNNRIILSHAAPSAVMGLFLAFSSTPVPFKGGTLMPFPALTVLYAATDSGGRASLPFGIPPGVPSDTELWMQIGISDPAAIFGVALSNAIVGITP